MLRVMKPTTTVHDTYEISLRLFIRVRRVRNVIKLTCLKVGRIFEAEG